MDKMLSPPIRTALTEDGEKTAGRTSKEWYFYWQATGDQLNAHTAAIADLAEKLDQTVEYGTHALRPAADAVPEDALYVESDRGNVIYQSRVVSGVRAWVYVTGTMLGTFSPDQRPTGLGVNDTGFQFRATDTANAQRTFYWSGTAWVETTVVQYGTHAARPAAATLPIRALYVETDRSNVIYQQQGGNWVYVAGIMLGTISPDQRPTGLGANDTGFRFEATDTGGTYRWGGAAWVNTTPAANTLQYAAAAASLTLTTTYQDIAGLSLTLTRNGSYLIVGILQINVAGGDNGAVILGQLVVGGTSTGLLAVLQPPTTGAASTQPQQWVITVSVAPVTIKLQANKSGGTGSSNVGLHSTLTATWISP